MVRYSLPVLNCSSALSNKLDFSGRITYLFLLKGGHRQGEERELEEQQRGRWMVQGPGAGTLELAPSLDVPQLGVRP